MTVKIDWSKDPLVSSDLVPTKQLDLDVLAPKIDVSRALVVFGQYDDKIEQLYQAAIELVVKDDLTLAKCSQLGGTIQGGIKDFTSLSKKILKPFKDVVSTVNTTTKMRIDRLQAAKKLLAQKANLYHAEKELAARKRAEKEREEAKKLQDSLAKQAEELGVEAPQIDIPTVAPPKSAAVRTATGTSYQREKTVVEVTDANLLPRKYLQPNMPMIRKAAEGGVKIPGVMVRKFKDTEFKSAKN
jgi:hypothetical protein